jgi:hypothetical protein
MSERSSEVVVNKAHIWLGSFGTALGLPGGEEIEP